MILSSRIPIVAALFAVALPASAQDWATAYKQKPLTAAEARQFMDRLAGYVRDNHLKKDPKSEQRGMVYEYFDTTRKGQFDQFVQGEALDTMHDGAWLAAALVNADRAGGGELSRKMLVEQILPFYCKMLNHSDTLFTAKKNDSRPGVKPFDREHAYQQGEKGFVPYWWDDGGSISLERRRDRNPLGPFPCTDLLAGKDNTRYLLSGYSHGSSNHLAQDLGVMLQLGWLLLRDSKDPAEKKLAAEVAEAAWNLHQCRMRHHGHIPMCDAPAALSKPDAALMKHVPDQSAAGLWKPSNYFTRALYDFKPGQRQATPGFSDDQQLRYYHGLARHGGELPKALAFKTIYDALTEPLLYRAYSDDAPLPPGINRFDLHTIFFMDGKPADYRSDCKGPGGKPRPIGSRMGPQNMVCCGWALQALVAHPGIWEERYKRDFAKDLRVPIFDPPDTPPRPLWEPPPAARLLINGVKLETFGQRDALRISGEFPGESFTFKVYSKADAQGTHAAITVKKDRTFTAVNDRGEKLEAKMDFTDQGKVTYFGLTLPYTWVKGQKPWANAIEHGRLSLESGKESRNLYFLSDEQLVRARLEHELSGGLRTWEAIFKEKGFIPTGIGAGAEWDRFSDSGGYAHLISATAQWVIYLEGKKDWELHAVPSVR